MLQINTNLREIEKILHFKVETWITRVTEPKYTYYMVSSELLLEELLNWCNIAFKSREGKGIPFGKRDVVMIDVTE